MAGGSCRFRTGSRADLQIFGSPPCLAVPPRLPASCQFSIAAKAHSSGQLRESARHFGFETGAAGLLSGACLFSEWSDVTALSCALALPAVPPAL